MKRFETLLNFNEPSELHAIPVYERFGVLNCCCIRGLQLWIGVSEKGRQNWSADLSSISKFQRWISVGSYPNKCWRKFWVDQNVRLAISCYILAGQCTVAVLARKENWSMKIENRKAAKKVVRKCVSGANKSRGQRGTASWKIRMHGLSFRYFWTILNQVGAEIVSKLSVIEIFNVYKMCQMFSHQMCRNITSLGCNLQLDLKHILQSSPKKPKLKSEQLDNHHCTPRANPPVNCTFSIFSTHFWIKIYFHVFNLYSITPRDKPRMIFRKNIEIKIYVILRMVYVQNCNSVQGNLSSQQLSKMLYSWHNWITLQLKLKASLNFIALGFTIFSLGKNEFSCLFHKMRTTQ